MKQDTHRRRSKAGLSACRDTCRTFNIGRGIACAKKSAPIEVAVASANRALSSLDENPLPLRSASSSSWSNIPVFLPVPRKVPIVSNVSARLNVNISKSTFNICDESLKSPCNIKLQECRCKAGREE
jgi:hypothetical protein